MRFADCHPDRKHAAKGMCEVCYNAHSYAKRGARYYAAWRVANPDKRAASYAKWYLSNPGYHAAWWATHPEKHCALEQKRRARQVSAPGEGVSAAQFAEICEAFGHACAYCLRTGVKLTLDHVEPLSRGGAHDASNVVPACKPCNSSKNADTLLGFLLRKGGDLGSIMVESGCSNV